MTDTTTPASIEISGETFDRVARLKDGGALVVWVHCGRCGGRGHMEEYAGIYEGECFECRGRKGSWIEAKVMERRAKQRAARAAKKAREAQAQAEAARAGMEAFEAANPELAFMTGEDVHDPEVPMNHIVRDIAMRLQVWGSISDKQRDLCAKIVREDAARLAQREAERASATPAPVGRAVVEGKIVKAVAKINEHSYHEEWIYRITVVTDAGWLANGNAPRALLEGRGDEGVEEFLRGKRVRFTATLEPKDDPTFAFFKRPVKAEIIAS